MTSYEKKQQIIEIYKNMKDNIEIIAEDMMNDPEGFVPSEYANVPKVSDDVKKIIKEAGQIIWKEIQIRMNEIYRL